MNTTDINNLKKENQELQLEINELKEKLKKYTNPKRYKKYYENHKEELKERGYSKSNYKPTREQRQLYNKRYYDKKNSENK